MIIWILTIEHRHGTNVYAHQTKAGAEESLMEYVDEWWDSEMDGAKIPENRDEAIDGYFSSAVETYYLQDVELGK